MPRRSAGILPARLEFKGVAGWKPALRQHFEDFFRSLLGCAQRYMPVQRFYEVVAEVSMGRFNRLILTVVVLGLIMLPGCGELVPRDTSSLLVPRLMRSEIFGFLAGFGTTFAALPDLITMLRRRSSAGMNPRMAAIMGVFQILWVYYGLLIASRPVIVWNVVAVLTNSLSVLAYRHFVRKERASGGH